jgi:hypothetical protein
MCDDGCSWVVCNLYLPYMDSCGVFIGELVFGDTSNSAWKRSTLSLPRSDNIIIAAHDP